jgi:hypothetical protein
LLTPRATTINETQENFKARMNSKRKNDRKDGFPNLQAQVIEYVNKGLIATPSVMDASSPKSLRKSTIEGFKKGWKKDMSLTHQMIMGMLPTPMSADWKGGKTPRKGNSQLTETLGVSSQLNPLFVEEMMGYPLNWTSLKPNTVSIGLKDSETL